jgi:hypothetical protein
LRIPLALFPKKKVFCLLFIICLCGLPSSALAPGEVAVFRGRVFDSEKIPVADALVTVSGLDLEMNASVRSDASGEFMLVGIPPGVYRLHGEARGFGSQEFGTLFVEAESRIFLELIFVPKDSGLAQQKNPVVIDETRVEGRTAISLAQIESLPSGRSIWNLIENQDFSATTNRIDVGGMWATTPALFSARGSASWTQNTYLLNGLDITNPYETGLPLAFPDLSSLRATELSNALHSIQFLSPGGQFSFFLQECTSDFHGEFWGFYLDKSMTASNVSASLKNEGLLETHTFDSLKDFSLHVSGPLAGKRWQFFTAVSSQSIGRNIANYDREDTSELFSGTLELVHDLARSRLSVTWTGQSESNPSLGASRNVSFVATLRQNILSNVVQAIWESKPAEGHYRKIGLSLARSDVSGDFQAGARGPSRSEIFQNEPSGSAPASNRDARTKIAALFEGISAFQKIWKTDHLLEYGLQAEYASASSAVNILDNLHLVFWNGQPLEAVFFNTPLTHRESSVEVSTYAQDTVHFGQRVSAFVGLHADWVYGWNRQEHIRWLNLSPRLGLSFFLSNRGTSFVRAAAARYYFTLPLSYLAYGNPDALGDLVYSWQDANGDGSFEDGEQGTLLRREGPAFAAIDSHIKRPYTDELSVSFVHDFGNRWTFSLAAFVREIRDLVETANVGVLPSDYTPVSYYDEGDDRIPGTPDDLWFTVYDQNPESFGRDFLLLTNPEAKSRVSKYRGLDLTLVKKTGQGAIFFLALTATEAIGTTSPGNTEMENDDGVIGRLYDEPNASINARGRLRFDRAYTGRIGASFKLPFGFRIAGVIKYYDGQPFSRKIIIEGLNQGPFFIQAHPRGVSRYEYNMTFDARLAKDFAWDRGLRVQVILDVFNLFNSNLATAENEWTGPEFPLRLATEIQSPRVLRLGLNLKF